MTSHSLSKDELLALETQALEANLTQISLQLLKHRQMLATAESCTGGMIAAACTDLAGSSQWFERGFITYDQLNAVLPPEQVSSGIQHPGKVAVNVDAAVAADQRIDVAA